MRTDEGARTSFLVPSLLSCRTAVQFMPSLLQVQKKKKTDVNLSPFVNHFEQKRGNRRMSQKDRQERAETHTHTKRDRSVTLLSGKRRTKKKEGERYSKDPQYNDGR